MPLSREKSLPLAAALGTAALSSGAIARWNPWALEWVALVPVFFFLPGISRRWPDRGPLLFGWVCGFFVHLFVFRWLTETVTRFTNLPWPVAVGILLLFAASHGLLWALWFFASERLTRHANWPRPLALPAVYVVCAAFLPQLFPWFVGMAQHHFHPFAQIAAVGGIELAVFLLVLANTALAGALRAFADREKVSWKPLAAAGAAVVLACLYGTAHLSSVDETLAAAPEVRVALLQPNVEAKLAKGPTESADRLGEILSLLREGAEEKTDLLILPEAALPFRPWGGAAGVYKMSEQDLKMGLPFAYAVQELGAPLVTGAVLASEKGWFNSALLYEPVKGKAPGEITPNDLIRARYDKRGLLAFGEKLPFEPLLGWLRKYLPGLGTGFEAGEGPVTFETVVPLEMSICYEAILPPMTREAVKTEKGVLLNLTNDAWFGKGDERHQHWSLAVWRTIENGVWLLRATNTGRTSAVDPAGRETARAPESERAILRASVRPASLPTFYRRAGHFFPAVCALWVLSGLALSYQRRFMGTTPP